MLSSWLESYYIIINKIEIHLNDFLHGLEVEVPETVSKPIPNLFFIT